MGNSQRASHYKMTVSFWFQDLRSEVKKESSSLPTVYITDSEKGCLIPLIVEIPIEGRLTQAGHAALVPRNLLDQ